MRRAIATLAVIVALPATASADLYNPTTMQDIPSSYYYPPPAPSYDPPPMTFPPLDLTTPGSGTGDRDTTSGRRPSRSERLLGYRRSPKVSREGNRQLAALFARRLGAGNFDRRRFIREADKGTFRAAFRRVVKPLGWSDTNFGDALAAYTICSYMIVNGIEELSSVERAGARAVADDLRKKLLADRRMRTVSARGKQLATERLNTVTIVQLVQFATGDADRRATQAEMTRTAGLKTFRGDLSKVQLGPDGFEPRDPG